MSAGAQRRLAPVRLSARWVLLLLTATLVLALRSAAASAAGTVPVAADAPLPGVTSSTYSIASVALTDAQTQRFTWAQIDVVLSRPLAFVAVASTAAAAGQSVHDYATLFRGAGANATASLLSEHAFFASSRHPLNRLLALRCPASSSSSSSPAAAAAPPVLLSNAAVHARAEHEALGDTAALLARARALGDDLETLLLSGAPTVLPSAAAAAAAAEAAGDGNGSVLSLLQGRRRAAQPLPTLVALLSSSDKPTHTAAADTTTFTASADAGAGAGAAAGAAAGANFPAPGSGGAVSVLRVHVLLSAPSAFAAGTTTASAATATAETTAAETAEAAAGALTRCQLLLLPAAAPAGDGGSDGDVTVAVTAVDAATGVPVSGAISLTAATATTATAAALPAAAAAVADSALAQALTGELRALRRRQRLRATQVHEQRRQQARLQRLHGLPSEPAGPDDFSIFIEVDARTGAAVSPNAGSAGDASAGSGPTKVKPVVTGDAPVPRRAQRRRDAVRKAYLAPLAELDGPSAGLGGRRRGSDLTEAEVEGAFTEEPTDAEIRAEAKVGAPVSSLTAALMEKMERAAAVPTPVAAAVDAGAPAPAPAVPMFAEAAAAAGVTAAEAANMAGDAGAKAVAEEEEEEDEDDETFARTVSLAAVQASEDEMGDLTTVFFETAAKVEAVLTMEARAGLRTAGGARARAQQVLASVVDPICEMVPPVMGEVSMNTMLPGVTKTVKGTVGDMSIDALLPAELDGVVGEIQEPQRTPDGQAQAKLDGMNEAIEATKRADLAQAQREAMEGQDKYVQVDKVSMAAAQKGVFIEAGAEITATAGAAAAAEATASTQATAEVRLGTQAWADAAAQEDPVTNTNEPQMVRGSIDMGLKTSLASKLVAAFMTEAVPEALTLMHQALSFNVAELVNNTVTRVAARTLAVSLTHSIVLSMTHTSFRIFSGSLTRLVSQSLSRAAIHSVTSSASLTITRALTRTPVADVFCELCRMGGEVYNQPAENVNEFCDACWSAESAGQTTEAYTGHYGRHFAMFYGWHYGGHYARLFADDYLLPRVESVSSIFPPVA